LEEIFGVAFLLMETLLIQYPEIQVKGVVGVADFKNIGVAHVRKECRIKVGNLKSGSIISGRIIVGMGKIRNA